MFYDKVCIDDDYSHHLCLNVCFVSRRGECELSRMEAIVWDGRQRDGLWHVLIGAGYVVVRCNIWSMYNVERDARHRFITCPVAKAIWVIISQSRVLNPKT